MATPDDPDFDRTSAEAERWLEQLNRTTSSRGAAKRNEPAERGSQTSQPAAVPTAPPATNWPIVGLALAAGALLTALAMALALQISNQRQSNRGEAPPPSPNRDPSPTRPAPAPAGEQRQAEPRAATATNQAAVPAPEAASPPQLPAPVAPPPQPQAQPKVMNRAFQPAQPVPGPGAWGSASDYKFGRLPDSTYPDSCAFSRTDSAGQTIISRSRLDYWACKDEGGNINDGYSVAWVDGKRTKYAFGPDGGGSVVGTNGSMYPIRWRNDHRNGSRVIILSHQDGATTWIPGHVD